LLPVGMIGREQVERGDPETAGLRATSRAVNHFYPHLDLLSLD
jgi:hypothetical protein